MSAPLEIVQLKVRLLGISPMVWRRVLIPLGISLRELHGVIQVSMGWEGIHLYQFDIRAVEYGSFELFAENPDLPLSQFGFRDNDRFAYIYDMGACWQHELRIEGFADKNPTKSYPLCTGGSGACPPEDCGGVEGYLARRDEAQGYDAWMDLGLIAEFVSDLIETRDARMLLGEFQMDGIRPALDRMAAREPYVAVTFSRRAVNKGFRDGRHQQLMHQQLM